jgi:glycosyltransferase involved in cell wall biosynthesis
MKLLLVTPVYEPAWRYGGVVSSNATLCRGLAKLGVEVTVYTTNASKSSVPLDVPLDQPVDVGGVKVYYFKSTFGPNNNFCSTALTRKLWQTVADFDVVYVVALWQWIGIEAAKACHKMKVPMVVAIKGGFSVRLRRKSYWKKQFFWMLFLRRALQKAAAIHLTNRSEKAAAGRWLEKLSIIYVTNPVNPNRGYSAARTRKNPHLLFSLDSVDPSSHYIDGDTRSRFRAKYGIPQDAPVLISVARPSWKKRIDLLIGALSRDKAWWLVFVGEHSVEKGPEWKRYARKLGVSDRVVWTGFLSGQDLTDALSSADLFALVSENENFGMVVVEAMLCGLPVMISRDVGVWDEICDEPFAIPAERSVDSIVSGMSIFQQRRASQQINTDRIRQVAIDKFSPPVVARSFLAELQKVISMANKPLDTAGEQI